MNLFFDLIFKIIHDGFAMTENSALINENKFLKVEVLELKNRAELAEARVQVLENALEHLKETLRALQRAHFGTKSERYEAEEQGLLFNDPEVLSLGPESGEEEDTGETVDVKGHQKTRGQRRPLPQT